MNSNPRRLFSTLTLLLIAVLSLSPARFAAEKRAITEMDLFKFAWIADPRICAGWVARGIRPRLGE